VPIVAAKSRARIMPDAKRRQILLHFILTSIIGLYMTTVNHSFVLLCCQPPGIYIGFGYVLYCVQE
jgi:hypothetical protein